MKKIKGFSLMELIITITIIFILSVISGPIYKTNSTKTKMAEGYALLGTLRSAQDAYFRTYDNFLFWTESSAGIGRTSDYTCSDDVLGIDTRPNKYYTLFTVCKSGSYNMKERYEAVTKANGLPSLTMSYNITTGVTFKQEY